MIATKKPREIYYDITITNFESSGSTLQPLRFSETRNNPLIYNSGDYSLSIVRFQLDTYNLPSFIADIVPYPNTDPNKMIETITMDYFDGTNYTTVGALNLEWVPTNQHIPTPSAPNPLQDASTEYYYGNSFRHYCDIVNNCLAVLTEQLKLALAPALDNMIAPLMVWNEDNLKAEILAQEEFFDWKTENRVNIYFNRALYAKFTSLPAYKNYNATDGKIYNIYFKNDYETKHVTYGSTKFVKTSQEYSTISNWSPVSSIVFTTASMPVYATQLSEPIIYNNNSVINLKVPQNFSKIISDMATNDLCYKPNLIYVPSAEYRMIDMFGTDDINTIDINVYWKDKKGNLIPFYLQSGASASVKLLFRLK